MQIHVPSTKNFPEKEKPKGILGIGPTPLESMGFLSFTSTLSLLGFFLITNHKTDVMKIPITIYIC